MWFLNVLLQYLIIEACWMAHFLSTSFIRYYLTQWMYRTKVYLDKSFLNVLFYSFFYQDQNLIGSVSLLSLMFSQCIRENSLLRYTESFSIFLHIPLVADTEPLLDGRIIFFLSSLRNLSWKCSLSISEDKLRYMTSQYFFPITSIKVFALHLRAAGDTKPEMRRLSLSRATFDSSRLFLYVEKRNSFITQDGNDCSGSLEWERHDKWLWPL